MGTSDTTDMLTNSPGEDDGRAEAPRIHDMQLLETLGEGGFGAVYRAIDERLGRTVALKALHHIGGEEDRERFLCEAVITGNLQHPHIVPIHGLGSDSSGNDYFTMPVVRGRTLADILDGMEREDPTCARFTRTRLVEIVVAVAEAVAYAHARGVVHRDLKPSNIMIGSFGEVFVLDWGIAKILDDPPHRPKQDGPNRTDEALLIDRAPITVDTLKTLAGSIVGTPGYMAPEQAVGDTGRIGRASDVFALGVILFECLTGQRPMSHQEITEHATEPLPDHLILGGQRLPRGLRAILLCALSARPEDRYPDAATLVIDLRAWLEDRPLSVCHDGPLRRSLRWLRHHPSTAASLTATLLTAVVAGYLSLGLISKQQHERAVLAERLAAQEQETRLASERRARAYSTYLPGLDLLRRAETQSVFASRAETVFRTALAIDDSLPEIHHALAKTLRLAGRIDKAIAAFEEAIRLQEDLTGRADPPLLRELGDVLWMDRHDWEAARGVYARVVEADPHHPHARIAAAILLSMDGRPEEAIADLTALAAEEPDWWEIPSALGMIQFGVTPGDQMNLSGGSQGVRDAQAAVDALSRAIELNPAAGQLFMRRGLAYGALAMRHRGQRQYDLFVSCLADYDLAVRLAPNSFPAHRLRIQGLLAMAGYEDMLGKQQAARARRQAALRAAEVLARRWPHEPMALHLRGQVLRTQDRLHELRPDLEEALRRHPDHPQLQEMLRLLPEATPAPEF